MCFPLGAVRLYEVSGQCTTEAGLLQLKKPDDRLANISLFGAIFRIYLPLLDVQCLLVCDRDVVSYFMTLSVTGCLYGRE